MTWYILNIYIHHIIAISYVHQRLSGLHAYTIQVHTYKSIYCTALPAISLPCKQSVTWHYVRFHYSCHDWHDFTFHCTAFMTLHCMTKNNLGHMHTHSKCVYTVSIFCTLQTHCIKLHCIAFYTHMHTLHISLSFCRLGYIIISHDIGVLYIFPMTTPRYP